MDETVDTGEGRQRGLDRRQVIRTAGVLGAAAWAVPAVTSFTSAAHAAGSVPSGCDLGDSGDLCLDQRDCGGMCFCAADVTDGRPNGRRSCTADALCDDEQAPLCTSDAQCPPGSVCQATCCAETRCFVVCTDGGAGAAAAVLGDGPRRSRRS